MGQYYIDKVTKKVETLSEYSENLFVTKYKSLLTNTSENLFDDFEKEIKIKAKELGMDLDMIEIDGEIFGFEDEKYTSSNKSFWIYYGLNPNGEEPMYEVLNYKWK